MTMLRSMCDTKAIAHLLALGHLRDSYGWSARARGGEPDKAYLAGCRVWS